MGENSTWISKAEDRIKALRIKKENLILIILSVLICITLLVSICLYNSILRVGANSLTDNYQIAYESERDAAYNALKEKYYAIAEENYHVSNEVSITVGDIKETAILEVLKVRDVEYVIENEGDNKEGTTSWLEVPGTATYVVNLQAAEFIIDDERNYILVRLPYPEVSNITIDYQNINKMFFNNAGFNNSYKPGEDLAMRQLNSADLLIRKEFTSNQNFYLSAQEAASNTIKCMIKDFNPNIKDLVVEVEFF